MSPEAQRIAIAEACGYTRYHEKGGNASEFFSPSGKFCLLEDLPDYLGSLDAMHEAEKVLSIRAVERGGVSQKLSYRMHLQHICTTFDRLGEEVAVRDPIFTTAAQRADGFLRTLNLWDDTK